VPVTSERKRRVCGKCASLRNIAQRGGRLNLGAREAAPLHNRWLGSEANVPENPAERRGPGKCQRVDIALI